MPHQQDIRTGSGRGALRGAGLVWTACLVLVLTRTAAADVVAEGINDQLAPSASAAWCQDCPTIGWYYTPAFGYELRSIQTNFHPDLGEDRDVTVEVLTDRRVSGGTLLGAATFNSVIARGTLGGGVFDPPLVLTAGVRYLVGFRHLQAIAVNCTNDPGAVYFGSADGAFFDNDGVDDGAYGTRTHPPRGSCTAQPILRFIRTDALPVTTTSTSTSTSTTITTTTSTTTSTVGRCSVRPLDGCQAARPRGATLLLRDGLGTVNDKLAWTWTGTDRVTLADLGDPRATTAYSLCLYAGETLRLGVTAPADAARWSAKKSGFRWNDPRLVADGLRSMVVKPGGRGRGRLAVVAQQANLHLPALPLPLPLTVQVHRRDGGPCWTARFSRASSSPTRQRGRSD